LPKICGKRSILVPEILPNRRFIRLRARVCNAMLGVFRDWSLHMEATSNEQPAAISTRWQKGQSGNPKGRPRKQRGPSRPQSATSGSGRTPTWLARLMIERPVERADGLGGTRTRLAEYMYDIVERADAGDLKCRMFLIRYVDRGDRRRLAALRNAEKAKTRALRELESAGGARDFGNADGAGRNGRPPRQDDLPDQAFAGSDHGRSQARAVRSTRRRSGAIRAQGHLLDANGNALSREAEDRLRYPDWPHISPHLRKEERPNTGPDNRGENRIGNRLHNRSHNRRYRPCYADSRD
jgi:hypothetical protein